VRAPDTRAASSEWIEESIDAHVIRDTQVHLQVLVCHLADELGLPRVDRTGQLLHCVSDVGIGELLLLHDRRKVVRQGPRPGCCGASGLAARAKLEQNIEAERGTERDPCCLRAIERPRHLPGYPHITEEPIERGDRVRAANGDDNCSGWTVCLAMYMAASSKSDTGAR
jgi:hypothetical protein